MDEHDLNRLGSLFRTRREQLAYKIEDLAEDGLSISTISNFETGKKKVKRNKIIRLFEKVGITYKQIPSLVREEKKKIDQDRRLIHLHLLAIENHIQFVCPTQGLKQLKEVKRLVQAKKYEELLPTIEYIAGKAYYKKENWTKAKDHYYKSMQLLETHPDWSKSNVYEGCLYELARIAFRESDMVSALKLVEQGIQAFHKDGERSYLYDQLMISKVIYAEILERNEDAFDTLSEMWQDTDKIDTEVLLNMYQLQATLYIKRSRYENAVQYAQTGIDIARRNRNYDRSFELWTTLGSAYIHLDELTEAKICFESASQFEHKIQRKFLSIQNLIELGLLHLKEGNERVAQTLLEEAVKKAAKAKEALLHFKAFDALGDCLLQQQKALDAVKRYEQALSIAHQHAFLSQEKQLTLKLAQHYEKNDLTKHSKYCAQYYRLSVQLLDKGGETSVVAPDVIQSTLTERQAAGDPPDS
ncbi:helix-turn-helix transcriptional regulator [Hazenella sp. IB182353]|uniref:helix-turn-helix transcriptional regulator n=1 Tax=Polycladospora coralii TaxID=2771432 RepID=UPI001746F0CA|nr:helix-turn-helix transcriptional regulator [Polycladospora coralii]